MKVTYTKTDDGKYQCDECGWTGSRSGFYKHRAVHASLPKVESETIPIEEGETVESPIVEDDTSTDWMDWGESDDTVKATDVMPTPLKSLQKKATDGRRAKRTKAELETARTTSKSLITLGLTFGDTAMGVWGRGVLIDPNFEVKHSDRDKEITADAVAGAMEERGLFLSDSISRTAVATVMLGWYFGAPTYRITKKAKRGLFKGGRGSGLMSRIPLIGRLFRRKRKPIVNEVEEVE